MINEENIWNVNKECKTCGELFKTPVKCRKYCSKECKRKSRRKYNLNKREFYKEREDLCSQCGKERESIKYKICYKCREYRRNWYRKNKK